MVKITRINGGGSNCYLITENNKSILVDTGMKNKRKEILEFCKDKNVVIIILTHGHIDHCENAAYLSKELGVPIGIHKDDLQLIGNNLIRPMKSKGVLGGIVRYFSEISAKKNKWLDFKTSIFLKDGDNLDKYGINGKIIGLPGHTAGSIGILVGDNDFLVGDALMNMFSPSVSLLYEDQNAMLISAEKIEKLGNNKIHFGHGKPVMNRKWVK